MLAVGEVSSGNLMVQPLFVCWVAMGAHRVFVASILGSLFFGIAGGLPDVVPGRF